MFIVIEGNRANDRRRDADRPNNFRVKQERGEQGRQESTSSRGERLTAI